MAKLRHEASVEILQNEPELVLTLLKETGVHLQLGPGVAWTRGDTNLTDRDAGDEDEDIRGLFADNVFVFEADGRRVAVVAEVQTDPPNEDRRLSWPAYLANARRQHRCDTLLLVFAIKQETARGCVKAIRTGHPGWDLVPLVSGIGRTPGIPPEGGRFAAELVLLRIITRELALDTHDARMFALSALRSATPERIRRYSKYIKKLAPPQARPHLETLMKTVLKDAFVDGWFDQGRLEEARENVLQLLEEKFTLSEAIRKRVEECADLTKVKTWFTRAISAKSISEVFAD
jgi:hypothetical protein